MDYVFEDRHGVMTVREKKTIFKEQKIRFIDSSYNDLFDIPDNSPILVKYSDNRGTKAITCHYLDDYHFYTDNHRTFHICEFAELMEKIGATYMPFPEKRIVWSNLDLNIEDWRDGLLEEDPTLSENELYDRMVETNNEYFEDERYNLAQKLGGEIIAIGDIGRWNGRVTGYQEIRSSDLKNCLSFNSDCDYGEWYVDREGEFRSTQVHHDGTNYICYRMFKPDATDEDKDELKSLIYEGKATQEDIDKYTEKLGHYVADVYGWDYPTEDKKPKEKSRGEER